MLDSAINNKLSTSSPTKSQGFKKDLGNFWIETVQSREKSPTPTPQRLASVAGHLTSAAERLEQLAQESPSINGDNTVKDFLFAQRSGTADAMTYPYRRTQAADSVASRRNLYLKEAVRAQSPNLSNASYASYASSSSTMDNRQSSMNATNGK